MGLFGDIARAAGDVMTFGSNEVVGNPIGKAADQITNPTDPNAANNALNQESLDMTNANNLANQQLAQQNIQLQEEFAQNGITWRVADAARNGISPLAALGATEPSYSPVQAVMSTPNFIPNQPTQSLGNSLLTAGVSEFGAGVARSLLSTQTEAARESAALDLAYKAKQNDFLDVQIAGAKLALAQHSMSPPMPMAFTTMQNRDGTVSVVPSPEAAQSSHGQFLGPLMWSFDNKFIPALQDTGAHLLDVPSPAYPQGGTSSGLGQ